jgi:hypothetical protein
MMTTAILAGMLLGSAETRITPFANWTGATSEIHEARTVLVTTQAQWQALWKEHKGKTVTPPTVDWNRFWVWGIWMGPKDRCRGYITAPAPYGVFESDEQLVIRIKPNWRYGGVREEEQHPFLMMAIKKVKSKPLLWTVDQATESGQKPVWGDLMIAWNPK